LGKVGYRLVHGDRSLYHRRPGWCRVVSVWCDVQILAWVEPSETRDRDGSFPGLHPVYGIFTAVS
jgi:hypothetical protein